LYKETPEVELLTVRPPLPVGGLSGIVVNRQMIDRYYREEGEKALAPNQELLAQAGSSTRHMLLWARWRT